MLNKIYIDGFRHFKNFTLEPYQQTTLLSGLNGTGKTTIIEAISRLQLFLVNSLPVTDLCQQNDIPKWEDKGIGVFSTTLGFTIDINKITYIYEVEIRHNLRDSIRRVQKESLKIDNSSAFLSNEGNATMITDDGKTMNYPVDWTFTGLVVAQRNSSKIRQFLTIIRNNIFAASINPFAISSTHQEQESILKIDGSNFSAWFDYLLDKQFLAIANTLQEINSFIPGFRQFRFDQNGKNKELYVDISINPVQNYRLTFDSLSHGQKILCLLHLLIKICPESSTILIDEFENFLAPVELQPLYDAAQDAFEENGIQFIFVSHHHRTMNWFQDSAVILSFSGTPAFVRVEDFSTNDGLSIDEHLMAQLDV
jgi:predicted ATPase